MDAATTVQSQGVPRTPRKGAVLAGPVALVLALLCGLTLGRVAGLTSPSVTPVAAPSSGNTGQVRAFYDGMNRYLATGDDTFLDLLAPGFQNQGALDAQPGSSATLLAELDAMRQHASHPQFAIEELTDLGNLVEVRLAPMHPDTLDVAGLTATFGPSPATSELVRLERNAIVARWSQDDRVPLLDHVIDASVPIQAGDAVLFGIYRVTLEPGGSLELPGDAPFGVLVEEGSATLFSGATSQRLAGGDDRWVDPTGHSRVANVDAEPSVLFLAMIGIIRANYGGIDGMFDAPKPSGASIEQLVKWAPYTFPAHPGGLRLRIARATLPPGTELRAIQPGMGEGLGLLEGALEVSVDRGVARHRGQDNRNSPVDDRATVVAGEGIVALHDTIASYRVAGFAPATFFVLTAVPDLNGSDCGTDCLNIAAWHPELGY